MSKAEEAAKEKYPIYLAKAVMSDGNVIEFDASENTRNVFKLGYEAAEKDIIDIVKQYLKKGERCMKQSIDDGEGDLYTFWDGFHNCAENILRELEGEK